MRELAGAELRVAGLIGAMSRASPTFVAGVAATRSKSSGSAQDGWCLFNKTLK